MFIPQRLLEREKEHVEGFAPEVAVVTHAGGEELGEPLDRAPDVRDDHLGHLRAAGSRATATSRCSTTSGRTSCAGSCGPGCSCGPPSSSGRRDTPRTRRRRKPGRRPCACSTSTARSAEDVMAMPVHMGRKTASERFPGAVETFTIEALMRDGKALQAGTSHYLGQNFAQAYDVQFLGRDGEQHHAYATSWGVSTAPRRRADHGPRRRQGPAPAPGGRARAGRDRADLPQPTTSAAGCIDARANAMAGRVARRGRPREGRRSRRPAARVQVRRPRAAGRARAARARVPRPRRRARSRSRGATPARSRTLGAGRRRRRARGPVGRRSQRALFDDAAAFREANTHRAASYDELRALITDAGGFVTGAWCGDPDCEAKVKAETKATIRFLPLEAEDPGRAVRRSAAGPVWTKPPGRSPTEFLAR